jgi:hypothetical protein
MDMRRRLIVLAAALTVFGAILVGTVGFVVWKGAALAAGGAAFALEQARTTLEQAAPPEARERARERVDAALSALRHGRFDAAALRETALWLPGALVDGHLDAEERELFWRKLERAITPAHGDAAAVEA